MKRESPARSSRRGKHGKARPAARPARPGSSFSENSREIVELAPVGIFSSTREGRFLRVNLAFARMLGYDSPDDLLRMDIPRDLYFDPADRDAILARYGQADGIVRIEAKLKKKDGSPLPVWFDGRVVRGAKGEVAGFEGFVLDITERKRAEEALRRGEERFRALVEHSSEVTGLLDREGRFLYVSPSVRRVLGFEPEEILAMGKFGSRVHPDDLGFMLDGFRALVAENGPPQTAEFRARHKDGSWHDFEVIADNRLDDPDIRAVVMVYRDITERKRAKEEHRRREELFRTLVENSYEVISLFSREGRWLYVSPSVERMWGYAPEEMLAMKSFIDQVHPDDRVVVGRRWAAFVANPGMIAPVEFRARHKDGSWRYLEAITVNRLDDPTIGAIVANLRDATERRRAEEQRAAVLERVSDAFAALDTEWRFTYVNARAAETFGRTPEALLGKNIWTEFPESVGYFFHTALHRAAEKQIPIQVDGYYPPFRRWYELRIYPSRDGLSVFFQDITERKNYETRIRRVSEERRSLAARMETVREEESARIARELHDEIGQALTAIKIHLQTLQRRPAAGALAEELDEGLVITERAIESVRNLSLDLHPSVLDDLGLPAALRWYLDRQAVRAGLTAEFSAHLPSGRLSRDLESACFRVVQEAVTNVARHARARRVWVDLGRDGGGIALSIRDDGVGFDVAAAQARALGGGSLGILGMEERVVLLGGTFGISSGAGEGTRISVRFPAEAAAPAGGFG